MSRPMRLLESEVLDLPREDRARLARLILVSLEQEAPDEPAEDIDQAWAQEIERRVAELRSGAVELIPGDEVFREIEDLTR